MLHANSGAAGTKRNVYGRCSLASYHLLLAWARELDQTLAELVIAAITQELADPVPRALETAGESAAGRGHWPRPVEISQADPGRMKCLYAKLPLPLYSQLQDQAIRERCDRCELVTRAIHRFLLAVPPCGNLRDHTG